MTANRSSTVAGCVALLMLATQLWAGIRPSFYLEECVWAATDIVVAAQGDRPDGELAVLETWKGDLAKGAGIEVVDLPAAPIKISNSFGQNPSGDSVTGKRIVLFLKSAPATPPVKAFEGASAYGGAQVSAAWIEKGQAYAFQQIINPGPSDLHPLRQSEAELKKQTLAMLATKTELARVAAIASPLDRAHALAPMTSGPYWHARKEAFALLGHCGPAALPLLREMLRDDRYDQADLVRAIAGAAGPQAGKELTAILQEELAYWKAMGPKLKAGWWNADPAEPREALRNRYTILDTDLRVLASLSYQPARDIVTQIRAFWSSLPQLNDKSGLDQIIEECDKVLRDSSR